MSKRTSLIMSTALLALLLAACGTPPSTPSPTAAPHTPPASAATQPPAVNMPNPASENCVAQGGTVSIQQNSDGSEYGLCVFSDGKQCEEWAMQRGECPVGGIAVAGRYTGRTPAADAAGRVMELELLPDGRATMATQFIGEGTPQIQSGTWAQPGKNIAVTLDTPASEKQTLTFAFSNGQLMLQEAASAGYGEEGLTLARTPSGQTHTAEFGGVKISFDDQLAQAAQGENVAAIPVTDGPVLGGAAPAAIRFRLNDAQPADYFSPFLGQVLVYQADEWAQLDPAIAQQIADLKTLLAAKPVEIEGSIPVLPPIPAAQVFHVKPQYLDFKNGSGVGFVTYYSQAVNPITAHDLFYTFQGLTTDGQYYVAVYGPVTTAMLPDQANMDSAAYDEFAKNYEKFLADLIAQFNELVPAAYTPDLTLFAELVKSIEIGTPVFATTSVPSAIQPLPAEVCHGQALAMAQVLNVVEVTQSNEPLSDFTSGASGTGCQAMVTGTGEQFQGPVAVVDALGGMLKDQDWAEDQMLGAGGPTGYGVGYRQGKQLCMVLAEWQPDASANCPIDQPIAACELTPAQKIYTVSLNCGVQTQ